LPRSLPTIRPTEKGASVKIGIAGAGAIGGFLGARLAVSGQPVCALARGETLTALRKHGWRLLMNGESIEAPVTASDDASELGVQDLLIIAVKGPALPALAPALRPLIGPQTVILPTMNGVPWWFCQVDGPFAPFPLKSVDPDGCIADSLSVSQTLGCVVHIGASCPEPGLVRHAMGKELIIGEAAGGSSARTEHVARVLMQAGFEIPVSRNIRYDIWYKLWGNLTMNPVSVLTGATIDRLLDDPLVRDFCSAAMREAASIGERIGCRVTQQPEDRHAITRKLGAFKTSMLQDVEAGRAIELDSIVGAAQEIGRHLGMETPYIDAILGLTRLFARTRGLYPDAAQTA
jgi:2-dehydropantoate 2-reductase